MISETDIQLFHISNNIIINESRDKRVNSLTLTLHYVFKFY